MTPANSARKLFCLTTLAFAVFATDALAGAGDVIISGNVVSDPIPVGTYGTAYTYGPPGGVALSSQIKAALAKKDAKGRPVPVRAYLDGVTFPGDEGTLIDVYLVKGWDYKGKKGHMGESIGAPTGVDIDFNNFLGTIGNVPKGEGHQSDPLVLTFRIDDFKVFDPHEAKKVPGEVRSFMLASDFGGSVSLIFIVKHGKATFDQMLIFPAHWDPKLRIPRGQVVAAASIVSPKY